MLKLGYCLPIFAWPGAQLFRTPAYEHLDARTTMRLGKLAEDLGFHSLWVADHLMLGRDEAILEGWTTLAALAGMTERAQLGIIHYNNAFRHPSLTAKMVATLDQISGGRVIHFVDFGNRPREFLAYGLHPDDALEQRVDQMCEGIELALKLWTSVAPISFAGRHYALDQAVCEPKPAQQPHPPIWIGEAHPALLEATARYAQGWNSTPVSIDELRRRLAALYAACALAGRDFLAIEKTLEIQVLVASDHAGLRSQLRAALALAPDDAPDPALAAYVSGATDELPKVMRETWLAGTPHMVSDRIREYAREGITHFMLWFVDAPDQAGMRLFAREVLPKLA